jgi:hypothetical protein
MKKPCPFCGSENLEYEKNLIACLDCGARGPVFDWPIGRRMNPNDSELESIWNMRKGGNPLEAQLCAEHGRSVCVKCGIPAVLFRSTHGTS